MLDLDGTDVCSVITCAFLLFSFVYLVVFVTNEALYPQMRVLMSPPLLACHGRCHLAADVTADVLIPDAGITDRGCGVVYRPFWHCTRKIAFILLRLAPNVIFDQMSVHRTSMRPLQLMSSWCVVNARSQFGQSCSFDWVLGPDRPLGHVYPGEVGGARCPPPRP